MVDFSRYDVAATDAMQQSTTRGDTHEGSILGKSEPTINSRIEALFRQQDVMLKQLQQLEAQLQNLAEGLKQLYARVG